MDYLEDIACLRVTELKTNTLNANINQEIMKLVPDGFKISLFPSFFNTSDSERIGNVIRDTATDFLINGVPKKVMFSIGVKVFNYNHRINSIRIILVKLHSAEGAHRNLPGQDS